MFENQHNKIIWTYGLGAIALVTVAVAVLNSSCLFDTKYTLCEKTSLACPVGWACTADQTGCTPDDCGNGVVDKGEECDDGDKFDGNECDSNCTKPRCGNGIVAQGEECDDGNLVDGDGCDSNCTPTGCHNGITTGYEECDDGNIDNEDDCVGNCVRAECGDLFVRSKTADPVKMENCDDGNTVTEECYSRDAGMCQVCDASCKTILRAAFFCGDGKVHSPDEKCDDGNNDQCGTCSRDCQEITSDYATGSIEIQIFNKIRDGLLFILDDGINPSLTFEFDEFGGVTSPHVRIAIGSTDFGTAENIKTAINSSPHTTILIKASHVGSSSIVFLKHVLRTERGNRDIVVSLDDGGLAVSGMAGGKGGNCLGGIVCKSDDDCSSNKCNNGTCSCESDDDCAIGTKCNNGGCL